MSCEERRNLDSDVVSKHHHLEQRLKEPDSGDTRREYGELKRMATELVDTLKKLWEHEHQHYCNPDIEHK